MKDGHFGHLFVHFTQSKIQQNIFPMPNFEVGPSYIQIAGYMIGAFVFQSPKTRTLHMMWRKRKVGTFLINDRKEGELGNVD